MRAIFCYFFVASLTTLALCSGEATTTFNPAHCDNSAPMIFCLMPLMDPAVMSKYNEFQSLGLVSLVKDTPEKLASRFEVADRLCRAIDMSKICAGRNVRPVPWWNCPALLERGISLLMTIKQYLLAPGMSDITPQQIETVLRTVDDVCATDGILKTLKRNQQCLTEAVRPPTVLNTAERFNEIAASPKWYQANCSAVQRNVSVIIGAINETCINDSREITVGSAFRVYQTALKLIPGFDAEKCPLSIDGVYEEPSTVATTSAPETGDVGEGCHEDAELGLVCD